MQKYCIYKHTCRVNGKSYIGQTCNRPSRRWKGSGRGYEDQVFGRAIQKYGWENFTHEILERDLTLAQANEREKYWIAYYHTYINDPNCNGYNLTPGGDGGDSARCEFVRNKISEKAHKRKVICIETQEVFNSVNDACQINKHVANCLSGKRHTASGYHWAYLEDTQRQQELKDFIGKPPQSLKEQGLSKRARAVLCIETGEKFDTINKAISAYGSSIRAALDCKCEFAYGYHWIFVDDKDAFDKFKDLYKSNIVHKMESTKRPVMCIETGEIFESTHSAMQAYGSSIIPILKNKPGHKTAYGYHWKYLEEN